MFRLVVSPRHARAVLASVALLSSQSVLAQEPAAAPVPAPTEAIAAPAEPVVATPPTPEAPPAPAPVAAPMAEPNPVPAPEIPATPPAPTAPTLKPTASFFTRYEGREMFDQFGVTGRAAESDLAVFRARIGLATSPIDVGEGEQVVLQFTPQASGIVGAIPGTTTDANLNLHEGYLRLQGASHKFDAGRFELNYGDALIIGNLDWNETGRSFDGMRVRLLPGAEKTFVDAFVTLANPNTVAGAGIAAEAGRPALPGNPYGNGDSYFTGIYAALGGYIDPAMELEPYFLAQIETGRTVPGNATTMPPTTTQHTNPSTLFTLGTRFKHAIDVIDLRAEAGLQFGGKGGTGAVGAVPDGRSILAFQVDAEAGVSLLDKKLRVGIEGAYASGDDPTTAGKHEGWNHLYPTGRKYFGLMGIIGPRSNIIDGVLHVSASATPDLKVQLDGHVFSRPQNTVAMGATVYGSGLAGFEVDTGVAYTLGTNLVVRGLYGLFMPGEDVYGADRDPAHYVEIELRYDLK